MRELKATKINAADFAPFGTFFSMTEPEGYPLPVSYTHLRAHET